MRSVAEIQTQLDQVTAAITNSLIAKEYMINTSNIQNTVKRQPIEMLQKLQESLVSELSVATLKQNGNQVTVGVPIKPINFYFNPLVDCAIVESL
jgi:hypothetical protein